MVQLGALNSRMKDFYDIWLLMRQFNFEGHDVAEALKRTFMRRKMDLPLGDRLLVDEIYDKKSDRQTLWKAFLIKGGIDHAPEELATVAKDIDGFLVGPVEAARSGEPFRKHWQALGPWKRQV